jgi:protein TonB
MTMPYPLRAFEMLERPRHLLQPAARPPASARLAGIGVTIAIHLLIMAGLLLGVQVARPRPVQKPVMADLVKPEKQKPETPAATPRLIRPAQITIPAPEIVIQSAAPPPVIAAVTPPRAAPVAPPAAPSQGRGESRESYFGRLLAQLNRYKRYPPMARAAHITGVVMLHFVIDAEGRVLSFDIARSSGHAPLDEEALSLIRRAQPLPPLPAGFPTRTLDAVVPIEFSLRHGPAGFR